MVVVKVCTDVTGPLLPSKLLNISCILNRLPVSHIQVIVVIIIIIITI